MPPVVTEPAEVIETHTATVFLVGDRAFKLRKPVDFGFLDHRTREARLAASLQEVELNRRLAPDVYIGVFDVLDEQAEICDHLVAMRRMPADRRLSSCLGGSEDVRPALRTIIEQIAALHDRSPGDPEHDVLGRVESVRRRWTDGFEQLAPLPLDEALREQLDRMEQLAMRYLDGREPLFEARRALGRIRDGHGDLQADDIFLLPDGPRILDCIEFGDEYRWGDILSDVAFLAMDLERLGHPELGRHILELHQQLSGDRWPETLAHHYIAYRAHVRAKVGVLRHHQAGEPVGTKVRSLVDLSIRHLSDAQVRLTLIGGLPGTGKSTVARGLAQRCGAVLLRSDVIRRGTPTCRGRNRYAPEAVNAVYSTMLDEARTHLASGRHVILDATWGDGDQRRAARLLAQEANSDISEIRCVLPAAEARHRILHRQETGDDPSEATPAVAAELALRFEPWPEATDLSTELAPTQVLERAAAMLDIAP